MGRKNCNFHRLLIFYADNSIDTWSCLLVHFTYTKEKIQIRIVCSMPTLDILLAKEKKANVTNHERLLLIVVSLFA